jgi:hypothetical protein
MVPWETSNAQLSPVEDLESLEPWDRLEGENTKAFAAFEIFRDLGPGRTVQQVRDLDVHVTQAWPSKHRWTFRAEAWDLYLEGVRRNELLIAQREMAQRQAQQARDAADALMAPINAIKARMDTDPEGFMAELGDMPAQKLVQSMQASTRTLQQVMNAERVALESPTELTGAREHDHSIGVSDADRLTGILTALDGSGLLDDILRARNLGPVIDAEAHEVDPDRPSPETDDLSPSAPT